MTETKDTTGDGVAETTTTYTYDGTQQTGKTVWQGTDTSEATGKKLEQDSYSYNAQGRMASAEVKKYDSTGVLTEHTLSEYTYDDNGIRVSQTVSTDGNKDGDFADTSGSTPEDTVEQTKYLNDSNNPTGYSQVLEERVAGQLTKSVTLGLDVLAQWAASVANGGNLFLLYDGHGSTRMLVDATGAPLSGQVFRYDAFGNRLDGNAALTNLLYSGERTDPTGLQYLRARYYDPATGRFNRLDPFAGNVMDPQSLHKYLYCHANPVMGIDPSGNLIECMATMMINVEVRAMHIGQALLPAIYYVTQAAFGIFIGSSIQLILEQAGVVPKNKYTETVVMLSAIVATAGSNLYMMLNAECSAAFSVAPRETTRVFRVEGAVNQRILVGENGTVAIEGEKCLFLNFGNQQRANEYFEQKLGQGMFDVTEKSFEVPTQFVNELRAAAVPENMAAQFPNSPIVVDVTKALDQFGLRPDQIEGLKQAVIQGTGKEVW